MTAPIAHLIKDVTYRGRIIISSPMGLGVTPEKVNKGFSDVGFRAVQCWLDESDLPVDWPAGGRDDVAPAEETQAWVEGTWDKDSGDYTGAGKHWELYDYWPKNNQTEVTTNPSSVKTPITLYLAAAGGAAVLALILIVASRD